MKPRLTGLLAVVMAAAGGLAVGYYAARQTPAELPLPQAEQAAGTSASAPVARPRYRLAGREGKLAVYIIGKTEPELIFDIYLHHLPDVDRLRLEEGIEVEDYQQLLTLIEDFTS